MNLGAGMACGRTSSALAEEIASIRNRKKVTVFDRIHAAMIVISFVLLPFIIGMLNYFSPECNQLFISFINWGGNSDLFGWVKVLIIILSAALLIFLVNHLMFKLARLSIWYSLVIFTLTSTTAIIMLVLAMAKY